MISLLVDLRTAAEARADPIIGRVLSVPVPKPPLSRQQLADMHRRLVTFVPHAVRIGLVCAKGVRSSIAYQMLRQAGYNVVDLGGMQNPRTRQTLRKLGYWVY